MIERFAKGLLILLCVLWMAASGWVLLGQPTNTEADAYRQQMFEQKLKDCRGQFSERYDCMSALFRQKSSALAGSWAGRLLLIFGPPLAVSVAYAVFRSLRERRREEERNRARLERRERETRGVPQAKTEGKEKEALPLREIDEIRRRADERRRAAKQQRENPDPAANG